MVELIGLPPARKRTNLRRNILRAAALEQVAGSAGFDAIDHQLLFRKHRDHHDIAMRRAFRRMPYEFQAAAARQSDIHQQHLGLQRIQ